MFTVNKSRTPIRSTSIDKSKSSPGSAKGVRERIERLKQVEKQRKNSIEGGISRGSSICELTLSDLDMPIIKVSIDSLGDLDLPPKYDFRKESDAPPLPNDYLRKESEVPPPPPPVLFPRDTTPSLPLHSEVAEDIVQSKVRSSTLSKNNYYKDQMKIVIMHMKKMSGDITVPPFCAQCGEQFVNNGILFLSSNSNSMNIHIFTPPLLHTHLFTLFIILHS